jgi:hypothetical protein
MATRELPDEIKPVMENGVPADVVSCSAGGIPNTTIISQVYYVDRERVALSFQFFNKTVRNVRENPNACVLLNDPNGYATWILQVRYEHSETEGPIFDQMDMQIRYRLSDGDDGHLQMKQPIFPGPSVRKVAFRAESTDQN